MQSRDARIVAVLVAAAAGAAFVVGRMTAAPDAPDDDGPVVTAPRAPAHAAAKDGDSQRPVAAPAAEPPTAPPPAVRTSPPAGELLLKRVPDATAARVADADARAAKIRLDAQRVAENADRTAARQIDDEIAKERAFLADAARGGTMAMLRALGGAGTHPFGLVGSAESFAPLFERKSSGPSIDGASMRRDAPIADGATITFPAGLHSWSVSQLGRGAPFPKDVLVVGAGMDATIVRLDEFSSDDAITSLTFRDLTIDCADDSLTDLRSDNPATIRLERCRVIAFDRGAGDESMIAARSAAFSATDSRFEAGFSRSSGNSYGSLFVVGSGLLVRLERCTIVGPLRTVYEPSSTSTYDYVGCTFTNCGKDLAAALTAPPEGVRFERCTADDAAPWALATQRIDFLSKVAVAGGSPADLLHLLGVYHQSLAPLVADRAAFAGFFDRGTNGPTIDGATGKLSGAMPDAATVTFQSGSTTWNERERLPGFKGDLVLAGQGMDATLVRMTNHLECATLRLRDLTLDVSNGALPESQQALTTIRIERCRIVGFDTGAGGSDVFGSSGATAILAEDSRFESGYGRNPDCGVLFGGAREMAARFERCTLRVHDNAFNPRGEGGAILFANCRFLDMNPLFQREVDKPPPGLTLSGCSVEFAASPKPGPATKEQRLSLSDINPSWPKRER